MIYSFIQNAYKSFDVVN